MVGKVRIIGGTWRGRRLAVADYPGLRPTPDRVRETLFNWLADTVGGARCLDLFAGAGALGFEALSRGARSATLVERNNQLVRQLHAARAALDAQQAEIICAEALSWLQQAHEPFDIVFLDPPFRQDYVKKTCALLSNRGHLTPAAQIYTETERGAAPPGAGLQVLKQARAGQLEYSLYRYTGAMNEFDGALSGHL